jgi:arsenate reductase
LLEEMGIAAEFRDIKKDNPSAEEIMEWRSKSGIPLKKFFNTSGNSYKNLRLSERMPELNESDQLALLSSDGLLVKRPILVGEDFVLVGFKREDWINRLRV